MPTARDALLDAARALAVNGDWERTRMADVAALAGVSRQTLYNEFGSKEGLAMALAQRESERFLAGVQAELDRHLDDPVEGIRAATAYTLRTAADDPLLKAALSSARGPSPLLPLLTTRSEWLLDAAGRQFVAFLTAHWPHLRVRDAHLVADALVRLTVSHLVQPTEPVDRVAADLATLAARALSWEETP